MKTAWPLAKRLSLLLLSLLVVLFAAQVKTSVYKAPSTTVRTLAASKFWKENHSAAKIVAPESSQERATVLLLCLLLITPCIAGSRELIECDALPIPSLLYQAGLNQYHRPPPFLS